MKISHLINSYNRIFDVPDVCPICNKGMRATKIFIHYSLERKEYFSLFECPICHKCFVTVYQQPPHPTQEHFYYEIFPNYHEDRVFPKEIKNLSPLFVEIYNQSLEAEEVGMNHIAGMGYRKSLEFLVKDFCIHKTPDDESKIKEKPLGDVINEYINEPKILNTTKVSAWLGNDHTHYVKKWETKDISDLKKFIDTSVYFISADILAEEAEDLTTIKK